MAADKTFKLPYTVMTNVELNRLTREATAIDDALTQANLRKSGSATVLPKASHILNELVDSNDLNMLQSNDRKQLIKSLDYVRKNAPSMQISFSVDPSPSFLRELMVWLRKEIHPYLLIRVGLQPSIGAGCVIRTSNKYFDLSLRERFNQQKHLLAKALLETEDEPKKEAHEQPA